MIPVIGITECSKYANYETWVKNSGVEVLQLSYTKNNLTDLEQCHGIVLSGGEDVHPEFYNKKEYVSECNEINLKRDEFEWKVLEYSQKSSVPLLGICRGLQITNVFFGGTLIPDLESRKKDNHRSSEKGDGYHEIHVVANTLMHELTGALRGEINSSHHQAADIVGKGLKVNCLSPDQVIEGLERVNPNDPYLFLVQWHPERMKNLESPFSESVKKNFLKAVLDNLK